MKHADILIRCARKELSVQVKHADILIRCARKIQSTPNILTLISQCISDIKEYSLDIFRIFKFHLLLLSPTFTPLKAFLLTVSMVSEVKGLARLSSFSSTMTLLAIWIGLRIGVINKLISSSWTLPRPLTRFHTGGYCTN